MLLAAGLWAGHAAFFLYLMWIAMEKKRCVWYNK